MAPHAESPGRSSPTQPAARSASINGHNDIHSPHKSLLQPTADDELHDLIGVGFGPASLAVAVALHDALDRRDPQLRSAHPKVAFLERQDHFAWHAGMQISGATMQITFLKDLATLRNPKSDFTFINYLHHKGRLVQFTNLSTFLPRRVEYEDYMRWCASWFSDVVSYGQGVLRISPDQDSQSGDTVRSFTITSRDIRTRDITTRRARNVIIAAGGRPRLPQYLPRHHPRIIHSSQYLTATSSLSLNPNAPLTIAILGAGQSAAEIFNDIPLRFPNSTIHLIIKTAALRPSDDSPFVNEIFDPARVDSIYAQDPATRAEAMERDKSTNYGVVRLELLEHIYEEMYMQRLEQGDDESRWRRRIMPHRSVVGAQDLGDKLGRVRLSIEDRSKEYASQAPAASDGSNGTNGATSKTSVESLDADLVIVASGYERDIHEEMLKDMRHLMPDADRQGKWRVGRNYRVVTREGAVSDDAGIWLQGCNEGTHGLSDTLLSILAVRGGEIVDSIFGSR